MLSNHFAIISSRLVTKKKGIYVGAEERGRARGQTDIVEFIALPFPSSKNLQFGRQRNAQKNRDARAELSCG